MASASYIPNRGDVLWVDFEPHVGHEQGGKRPALVLSHSRYNKQSGLALVCPITTKVKGYGFEWEIPPGLPVTGAVLCDQVKNIDWRARNVQFCCKMPDAVVDELRENIHLLID